MLALTTLIVVPLLFALAAFAIPSERARPWLLPFAGAAHLGLTLRALGAVRLSALDGWLVLDDPGKVVLVVASILYFLCSLYAPGYLKQHPERPNRVFCICLPTFLGTLTLIISSHHLGLMWVAMEAATLASAPLIYFKRTARSLEAVWKYLIVGSVGIALALLGSLFLAYSQLHAGLPSSLLLEDLVRDAPNLSKAWLRPAFVILFVGYGTKMGLAPMHTWKPDAYGEAPGVVGALLAGGLTNCAFLAVLRFFHIISAAGEAPFAREVLVAAGLLSMAVAAVFMGRQRDYKRMLAYSSVEHMGILVLGIGIGGTAVFGSLLHVVNNGLAKGVMFLSAGNIHRAFASKTIEGVSGAMRRLPVSGTAFLLGFFAVTGSPPFGPFLSEFTILSAAIAGGHWVIGGLFLLMLLIVFVGMGATVLSVVQGEPNDRRWAGAAAGPPFRESFLTSAPILILVGLVLLLGLYVPGPLDALLRSAAALKVPS